MFFMYNNSMLKKSDLTVIRGGALKRTLPGEKFIDAYVTDTRLMGVLVIYIKWQISGTIPAEAENSFLHQYFYIETTEEGIESYKGVGDEDEEELGFLERSMLGGLGGRRIILTMNEAVFLVQSYADMTKKFGKHLPGETEEYAFVLKKEATLSDERKTALFQKMCGEIDHENQLINYFVMRYFAKDFFPVDRLASAEIDHDQFESVWPATLCRNEITPPDKAAGESRYLCESVVEEEKGHRIVLSEIGVERTDSLFSVSSFHILSSFAISSAEAAMKLSRPEFVTVYELAGSIENVMYELDERYMEAMQNLTEGGKLYINFKDDNRHISNNVYLLNDDVKEILYVTVEDQLVIGCYTLNGIKRLENRLMLSRIAGQLIEVAKYEFKEPILYDYTMSYGGDFVRYVEEIMGFDDDDK